VIVKDKVPSFSDKRLQKGIETGNNWYVGSQFEAARDDAFRNAIEARWSFFASIIELNLRSTSGYRGKVLDAGSGDGVNLELLTRYEGLEITASDYNRLRLDRVAERGSRR